MTKSAGTVAVSMPHCQFEMSYPSMSAIAAGANAMETAMASAVSGVRQRRRGFMCFGLPLLRMLKFLSFPPRFGAIEKATPCGMALRFVGK